MSGLQEQLIRELDRQRHGAGDPGPDAPTRRSPTCGDEVALRVDVERGVIRSLVWRGRGCTVSMASVSALAEAAEGLRVDAFPALRARFADLLATPGDEALLLEEGALGPAAAFAGLGRLPLRAGCASLGWDALALALAHPADVGSKTQENVDGDAADVVPEPSR